MKIRPRLRHRFHRKGLTLEIAKKMRRHPEWLAKNAAAAIIVAEAGHAMLHRLGGAQRGRGTGGAILVTPQLRWRVARP